MINKAPPIKPNHGDPPRRWEPAWVRAHGGLTHFGGFFGPALLRGHHECAVGRLRWNAKDKLFLSSNLSVFGWQLKQQRPLQAHHGTQGCPMGFPGRGPYLPSCPLVGLRGT